MELSSKVTTTWKVCTVVSLLGFFILLLLVNDSDDKTTITVLSNDAPTTSLLEPAPTVTVSLIDTPKPNAQPKPPPPSLLEPVAPTVDTPKPPPPSPSASSSLPTNVIDKINVLKKSTTKMVEKTNKCNIFDGKWVYKAEAKPSYMVYQCPFIGPQLGCQRNGRPDTDYEKWVWQPKECDIPMLNGTDMVERFRNKRVVLVGDSLNRNMWESLCCILYSSIPNASSNAHTQYYGKIKRSVFVAKGDYNFTVEFYWSPFLVEHNINHKSGKRVLVLDKLSNNSETWAEAADIMIFNSAHWWGLLDYKKPWDLFEYKGKLMDMPLHIAYKRAMKTWANWVEKKIDSTKTALFFRSVSAEHLSRGNHQWCYNHTKPIMDESYKPLFPISIIRGIESVLEGMSKSKIKYLNITKLSEYRIDAHPSIYRYKDWKIRAEKNPQGHSSTADCGHWCLPGIPDTWNRLLYASLYFDTLGYTTS